MDDCLFSNEDRTRLIDQLVYLNGKERKFTLRPILQSLVFRYGWNVLFDFVKRILFLGFIAIVASIFGKPVFGTTDDNILAGFVDGSYTGDRESKLIFIRPLIGSLLNFFQSVFPGLGIYSLFLLITLIISLAHFGTLIIFNSKSEFSRKTLGVSWIVLSVLITSWFTLGPTYTSAAMLITAVSLLSLTIIISSKIQNGQYINLILSLILFTIGFLIRPEGGIGIILVTTPVIIYIFFKQHYINFPRLFSALIGSLIIFGFDLAIQTQSSSSAWTEYDNWNNLRHQIQHRFSQNYLYDFQKINGWTVPEYHLFMDIAYGDKKNFNSEWLRPAFESTSFTRGLQGVLNASVQEVFSNLIIIFISYPYIIFTQLLLLIFTLNLLRLNLMEKSKIILLVLSPVLAALYYMSATLHTPERGVVPILYLPALMLLTLTVFFDHKENRSKFIVNFLGLGLIIFSIMAPNGILEIRSRNITNANLAILTSEELIKFNAKAIYIGPGNSEFYEYRNPYTNLAYWNFPVIITAGNWETFSPHWYKRLQNNGIGEVSVYEELFKENRFWFSNPIPDTAYLVELYLRDQGITDLRRQGVLDMKSGNVLFKFER
jgi:hypothetical protein